MPELAGQAGHDIVTSSGDTLLGADDKAGVAEIMAAVAHLAAHPELPRPTLRICFTPDEEVGEGASLFDIERFGAACAYTMDGSTLGELQDETFTGAEATSRSTASTSTPASRRASSSTPRAWPAACSPRCRPTADPRDDLRPRRLHPRLRGRRRRRQGGDPRRSCATSTTSSSRSTSTLLRRTAEEVVAAEPRARAGGRRRATSTRTCAATSSRYPEVVEAAERAIRAEGIEPLRNPIRGGTDGSMLSARGLPTPNIFAGGHEFHSVREWASVQDMAAAAAIVRLAGEWARR